MEQPESLEGVLSPVEVADSDKQLDSAAASNANEQSQLINDRAPSNIHGAELNMSNPSSNLKDSQGTVACDDENMNSLQSLNNEHVSKKRVQVLSSPTQVRKRKTDDGNGDDDVSQRKSARESVSKNMNRPYSKEGVGRSGLLPPPVVPVIKNGKRTYEIQPRTCEIQPTIKDFFGSALSKADTAMKAVGSKQVQTDRKLPERKDNSGESKPTMKTVGTVPRETSTLKRNGQSRDLNPDRDHDHTRLSAGKETSCKQQAVKPLSRTEQKSPNRSKADKKTPSVNKLRLASDKHSPAVPRRNIQKSHPISSDEDDDDDDSDRTVDESKPVPREASALKRSGQSRDPNPGGDQGHTRLSADNVTYRKQRAMKSVSPLSRTVQKSPTRSEADKKTPSVDTSRLVPGKDSPVVRRRDIQKSHPISSDENNDSDCTDEQSSQTEDVDEKKDSGSRNVQFYLNKIPSQPDGDYIETILSDWKGSYARLERHHGYIQWLFPISEKGMNYQSQPLKPHEAEVISNNKITIKRFYQAYELMLDFYGLKLVDRNTGELARAPNWKERFANLNSHSHNCLRITRMIHCFGELGQDHLQAPLVYRLMDEAFVKNTLTSVRRSCKDYWIPAVLSDDDRTKLETRLNDIQPRTRSLWS